MLLFSLSCILLASAQRFSLEEWSAKKLQVVKECQHHTVFFSGSEYLKIWKKGSWHFQEGRNEVFLNAADEGFFDRITTLKGVVIKNNECIGYITYPCNQISQRFIVQSLEDLIIKKDFEKYDSVVKLFRVLKSEIKEKKFCFFGDFMGSWNMGIIDDQCYFFDLDRIMTLGEYLEKWKQKQHLFFLNEEF